uniref:AlNc14C68G4779 protein n=1 Tax=Albugo laibachii Nc14 TaxID=890382 RepID=F0WDR0_9STRA|nr:AlNc14C68G4779 [Albugo laibachii Nc14]|eukprot:CCA19337.1 AlNc14C68G4779 [Albugo laibachii Nc14]
MISQGYRDTTPVLCGRMQSAHPRHFLVSILWDVVLFLLVIIRDPENKCAVRESNPGHLDGNEIFYH